MIAIINYKAGNLASVSNALDRLGADFVITSNTSELNAAEAVIFPGVGHAYSAMESLRENGLTSWLKETGKPVLGICLGMQLLYESSEEGDTRGLGVIPGRLQKFDASQAKVPHMGWNTFSSVEPHPLLKGISTDHFFYYVHSFYAPVNEFTLAECSYINTFAAVVERDNYLGVQFHPEKSGEVGSMLLQNFLIHVASQSQIKL
ncbi:imidazole glycerol phosphate synthase subunit HisH [Halalkalibaculum sp. DA3122]|uniref:imidazole glycerol phosphate synthase subunit HisH n=1 Tax=Halalkalibaculum sp. DA3122 TaxID=3373607 RepID=UPI0037547836